MNGLIAIAAVAGMLLAAGGLVWLTGRRWVSWGWLLTGVALVLLNDFLLTRGYGTLPRLLPPGDWNWQGKILALLATLAVASLPMFGWRASGLTWKQAPGSLKPALAVSLLYIAFFAALAAAFPADPATAETVAFQLTMPGLEEELFYRGVLLLALDRAFKARVRFLGVHWGWGALVSSALFGLTHAFGFSGGAFSFDPIYFALTAVPSLIAVWLVLRTRSLVLPVVLHNFGNAIGLLI